MKARNAAVLAFDLLLGAPLSPEELRKALDFVEGIAYLLVLGAPSRSSLRKAPKRHPPYPWKKGEECIPLKELASSFKQLADYLGAQAFRMLEQAEPLLEEARQAVEQGDYASARTCLADAFNALSWGLNHHWRELGLRMLLHGKGGLLE